MESFYSVLGLTTANKWSILNCVAAPGLNNWPRAHPKTQNIQINLHVDQQPHIEGQDRRLVLDNSWLIISATSGTEVVVVVVVKVVSYVVFGKFPSPYYKGMEKLVYEIPKFYPGWSMRVHLNWAEDKHRDLVCALACNNSHLDICDVNNLPGIGDVSKSFGMTWRFSIMGDPLVDRYIVRDLDAPIIQREVDAVNEWISLGTCYHFMKDHPHHHSAVMGGMWGGCNTWHPNKTREIRPLLYSGKKKYGADQDALSILRVEIIRHAPGVIPHRKEGDEAVYREGC
ncbi:hypothetical protein Pmani_000215 [Petrolisthes manimaculis]|uniref:Uncharacterized protein n=1 Tax=Petrolisthes manimaculis TaxID=1843537 RepID=A0AAE1QPN6_9EUCA|nr:hypothetical protein Pmani_000215 [Petrolisthes manimaculis]